MTSRGCLSSVRILVPVWLVVSLASALPAGKWAVATQSRGDAPSETTREPLLPIEESTFHGASPPANFNPDLTEKSKSGNPPRSSGVSLKPSEIKCAVFSWDARLPKPTLVLVCPPRAIFAPIHVYLKLTWKAAEDIPKDISRVVVSAGSQTRVKPLKEKMRVWLRQQPDGDENRDGKWVTFTRLDGVALEGD